MKAKHQFLVRAFLWLNGWRSKETPHGLRWCKSFPYPSGIGDEHNQLLLGAALARELRQ